MIIFNICVQGFKKKKNIISMTYKFYFQLDSIKWYKDGREFYRLHPHDGQVKIEMVLIIMIYEQ